MADAIHPTAIVDPRARLAPGVRIGAFSWIGPEVVLGPDVEIGHHVVLEGRVEVEPRVAIGHGTAIGGPPQDVKFKDGTPSGVRIGADTVIREHVTIHRAVRPEAMTEIGPRCMIMAVSHVAHDCRVGEGAIIVTGVAVGGHCEIGAFATIGGVTGCPQFTRVGAHAYVGGHSKPEADVPPYLIANGVPATARGVNVVGLRRAGIPPDERRALREAFRLLYRSGLGPGRAVERIRAEVAATPAVQHLLAFIEGARRRGIVPPPGGWGASAAIEDRLETSPEHLS
jgi:UDP-N-acetylglucosamine acyltransferase